MRSTASRRGALAKIGACLLFPRLLFAQDNRRRPSMRDVLFSNQVTLPPAIRPDPATWDNSTITAAWLGHATVLINFFGTTIITDPVFSERAGINLLGMFTLGPRRFVAPALSLEDLPPIDLILLSHAHMDHMDMPSLRRLNKGTPIVIAKNTLDLLADRGWKNIRELDWGERTEIAGVTIEGLRVNHFGWRFPWERDRSRGVWTGRSFNGYLLSRNGKNIVFGGDTAYSEYFRGLADRNLPVDLALLPIGAYDPWIHVHANPEQAVAMANQMKAKAILPIHWGTFRLSYEPVSEPIERLKRALASHSPALALEAIGQTWKLSS